MSCWYQTRLLDIIVLRDVAVYSYSAMTLMCNISGFMQTFSCWQGGLCRRWLPKDAFILLSHTLHRTCGTLKLASMHIRYIPANLRLAKLTDVTCPTVIKGPFRLSTAVPHVTPNQLLFHTNTTFLAPLQPDSPYSNNSLPHSAHRQHTWRAQMT